MERYSSVNVRQLTTRKGKPWQARAKYKENGKWREITKILPEAKGKREAEKIAEDWRRELNAQAALSTTIDRTKTVEEAVAEYLTRQYNAGELERSTYATQQRRVNSTVKPFIGSVGFTTLDRITIEGWITKLYNKGLSTGTILLSYNMVNKVYKYYYKTGDIRRNPFDGVKRPRSSEPRKTHLTKEQMDEYLTNVYLDYEIEEPMYLGLLIPFYTGMRRGEICGLRWRDVNLEEGTLEVVSAIGRAEVEYTKGPKNRASVRKIYLMPPLLEAFQKAKEKRKPEGSDFVLGGAEFMKIGTYEKKFKEFINNHNLVDAYGKKITSHCLRHNVGYLGAQSMDIASLSKMMGHAKRSTTLNIYGDDSPEASLIASKKLAEKFNKETDYYNEG